MHLRSLALLLAMTACGGTISSTTGPTDDPDGAADARNGSSSPPASNDAGISDAAIFDVHQGIPKEPGCVEDKDCNEPGSGTFGRCWKAEGGASSCLCRKGGFKQPSGRCGTTPPEASCAGQGGQCSTWRACSDGKGNAATTSATCKDGEVCCVAGCKPTAVPYCYHLGTDAAYTPVCVAGWATCNPGDSPEIEVP
jgi:hypothetical protein